jgi:nucleotide-binding universal stress UspA family protein
MKVLMATDGSQHAVTAMLSSSRMLNQRDLKIHTLFVAPELVLEPASGESAASRLRIRDGYAKRVWEEGERILSRAQQVLAGEGLRAGRLVEAGSPADEILKVSSDYDLLVVGAHGKYERKQPGLGPVSSRIVQNARTTVIVGRELSNETNYRVLVALDGSDASFEALRSLKMYCDLASVDVTLMHVVELPWARLDEDPWIDTDADASTEHSGYQRELERQLRDDSERIIDRAVQQLEQWGIPATTIVNEGDPALEITSHVEEGNYDLVVVGATGSSDMKHALLGSVSLKLAWNCPCSVMVVRS